MGWRDWVPDSAEDWVEDRTEDVGDFVEWGGDKVAGLADDVGLHDAGDWVRDKSRSAANQLGADVAELELGQTDDPKRLVYGSPSKIREQVAHLNDFKKAFESVGNGLKNLTEPDGLKGDAATAFREAVAKEPPRWFKAADAFGKAAEAMGRFAETVEWAQGKAKEALDDYNKALKASQDAHDAHEKLRKTYNDALKAKSDHLPPRPSEDYPDPGEAMAKAAHEKLVGARTQRNEQAETVAAAVRAARDAAPPKPSYAKQLSDGLDYLDLASTHLVGGVLKGTAGVVNFARGLNPLDPYNLTHPAEYLTNLNSTAAGLVTMANDPMGAGKQMLDEFMKDPSEGIGKLIPELVGSKGLGTAKKVASTAKHLDDIKGPARRGVDDPANPSRTERAAESDPSDPIDLATGAMYLPQTDVALPGTLSLVFRRRVASDYRAGRWFGPSWSSTADQRLEIDPEGLVFVSEDGLLLSYPHPAPGVPVLPTHGPRWPLDCDANGDYAITDPDTGRVRRFETRDPEEARLVQIDDRNGNWITFEYDAASGAPSSIVHHGGYRLELTSDQGRITALHLAGAAPDGRDQEVLRYGYTDGHLTDVTNSSGLPLRFTYDDRGRVTSWTDTNESRYEYAYDEHDRCVAEGGAEGHVALRLEYGHDPDTGRRVTTATTSSGAVHRYLINEAHQICAEIDPHGEVTRFERDRYNRLLTHTDPLGRSTRFTYDGASRPLSVIRPDGRELSADYGAMGLPTRITHPDRTTVRLQYDERGNGVLVEDSAGAVTRYTYDESGRTTAVTDALGNTTRILSDGAGLPIEVIDPLGHTTRIERDGFGRPILLVDPVGSTTRLEWTPEGRLTHRVDGDGSE
ncbi:YD repeat-containing protein [Streptomyces sp. CG 926]|nr:DUF6531 domain-containing protein [Streptomyces sp. CG 926]PWK74622.1 YD repeat-containing protein [Streptomyces sp. CG 926]